MNVDLACFQVDDQVYGIDVLSVREILRSVATTPLPKAPRLIDGVVDLRGAVIPVVDLGRALGRSAVRETGDTRIALVEVDELVFGLRVDAAVDVISADASTLEEPPALATHAGYDAVRAVARREGQPPVLVISLEHVLESVYRSAPNDAEAGEHPAPAVGSSR